MLQSSGGRKPRTLSFVPLSHFTIGVEIALHCARMVIVDLWGSIYTVKTQTMEFEASEAYLDALAEAIKGFIRKSRIDENKLLGIAVSISGTVRANSLIVEYSSPLNVRNWDLSSLREAFDLPFILINSAYAAGSMEARGNGRMNKMFYISISEGIGGAYLINNDILTGFNNRAGSIGNMRIPGIGGKATGGTLEEYCSTTVLTGAFGESLDGFFTELKKGETSHVELWENYLHNLALGISNVRNLVDVAIVLGGALAQYMDEYIDRLLELAEKNTPFHEEAVYIRLSYGGGNAAAAGAAMQFVNRFLDF